jgi:hypothetical protein
MLLPVENKSLLPTFLLKMLPFPFLFLPLQCCQEYEWKGRRRNVETVEVAILQY